MIRPMPARPSDIAQQLMVHANILEGLTQNLSNELNSALFILYLFGFFTEEERIIYYHKIAGIDFIETALSLNITLKEVYQTSSRLHQEAIYVYGNTCKKTQHIVTKGLYLPLVKDMKALLSLKKICETYHVDCATIWTIQSLIDHPEKLKEVLGCLE